MENSVNELVIRKSLIEKIFMLGFSILAAIYGADMYYYKEERRGFVFIAGGIIFYLFFLKNEYKTKQPVLKINEIGVWVQGSGQINWESIAKIKINYSNSVIPDPETLEIYKIGQNEPAEIIPINNINVSMRRLSEMLRKRTVVE